VFLRLEHPKLQTLNQRRFKGKLSWVAYFVVSPKETGATLLRPLGKSHPLRIIKMEPMMLPELRKGAFEMLKQLFSFGDLNT